MEIYKCVHMSLCVKRVCAHTNMCGVDDAYGCRYVHTEAHPSCPLFFSRGMTGLLSPTVAGGSSRNMASWT